MWSFPTLSVYDWSEWHEFVMPAVWPRAKKIAAKFGESAQEIAARVPESSRALLLHLDISDHSPFISDGPALVEALSVRETRVLNALMPDIRKRTIQKCCRQFGLLTPDALRDGAADELLFVKTDFNSAGEREHLLSKRQQAKFDLTPHRGRIRGPKDYYVARRDEIPDDVWNDRTLVVQRYVKNRANRFYRIYAALDAIVVSEAYSNKDIKRVGVVSARYNYFLWRKQERIVGDPNVISQLPDDLLRDAGIFLHRFRMDYGAIDIVESEDRRFFIVDANKTPHWGNEVQPGLIEHLRKGLEEVVNSLETSTLE
jgi:hypothetical protein